jgi:hypothetical protein
VATTYSEVVKLSSQALSETYTATGTSLGLTATLGVAFGAGQNLGDSSVQYSPVTKLSSEALSEAYTSTGNSAIGLTATLSLAFEPGQLVGPGLVTFTPVVKLASQMLDGEPDYYPGGAEWPIALAAQLGVAFAAGTRQAIATSAGSGRIAARPQITAAGQRIMSGTPRVASAARLSVLGAKRAEGTAVIAAVARAFAFGRKRAAGNAVLSGVGRIFARGIGPIYDTRFGSTRVFARGQIAAFGLRTGGFGDVRFGTGRLFAAGRITPFGEPIRFGPLARVTATSRIAANGRKRADGSLVLRARGQFAALGARIDYGADVRAGSPQVSSGARISGLGSKYAEGLVRIAARGRIRAFSESAPAKQRTFVWQGVTVKEEPVFELKIVVEPTFDLIIRQIEVTGS